MADKKLTIGIEVAGATQAAADFKKVENSIFGVEDAAKKAEREMDVLEAKRRVDARAKGGGTGPDISGAAGKLGQEAADMTGFGQEFRAVSSLISADAVVISGAFAAIGAAAVKSFDLLDETATRWREFEGELKSRGEQLPQEIADQIAGVEAAIAPVKTVIDGVTGAMSGLWKMVKDPVGELTGLNDLKTSLQQQDEMLKKLNATRLKMANENGASLASVYKREADGLKEQEETLRRIATLRGQLESIEQQRANRQVDFAKRDGGDVALAEANALAVRLKAEINSLNENLRQSQADVTTAQQSYDTAFSAYNRALTDKVDELDPAKFAALTTTLDKASAELQKSQSIANEQAVLFEAAKANIVEGVDNSLRDLESKYKEGVSKSANAAMDSIVTSMKETLASGPAAAIEQIKVEAGAITTAANERAAEVQQGLGTERAGTVQAIQNLAPKPADIQAVAKAAQDTNQSLKEVLNTCTKGFTSMVSTMTQFANTVAGMQAQINYLNARLR